MRHFTAAASDYCAFRNHAITPCAWHDSANASFRSFVANVPAMSARARSGTTTTGSARSRRIENLVGFI